MKTFLVLEVPEEARLLFNDGQWYSIFDSNAHREAAQLKVHDHVGECEIIVDSKPVLYPTVKDALGSMGQLDDFDLPDTLFEQISA